MPHPPATALGTGPLDVGAAYAALERYAADYGREALLLLLHAAVPETLRADLLNLIRVNFLAESGIDQSLEADILFSPLSTALGGGYYRIDPQVRWHCLTLLHSTYRDEPRPRLRRVAELLWRYVEMAEQRANRAADPQLSEFLDIQRWVALAILEPASAAHAFADALRQASAGPASAVVRLGGLTAAIEIPLASEQALLAYARGMNALVGGDEERARQLLEALGDEELRVGDVVLKAPTTLLAERQAAPVGEAAAAATSAPRQICLVLIASGGRSELASGRSHDPERAWALIRAAVTALKMDCVRVDEVRSADDSGRALYTQLLQAALVVCDLSADDPGLTYLLGVCWALRPAGTLLIAERGRSIGFASDPWPGLLRYELPGDDEDLAQRHHLAKALQEATSDRDSPFLRNPIYRQLPLQPPELGTAGHDHRFGHSEGENMEDRGATPRIFISYSHDTNAHKERVLRLSERLRKDGIETSLDQYVNGTPIEKWPRWMLNQIDWAEFILMVCTETYYRRFRGHEEPGKGKGVDWEGAVITQELYDARSATIKFVPVLFDATDERFIPEPVRGHTFYVLNSEQAYRDLYNFLLGQAGVEPGPLGKLTWTPRRRAKPLVFEAKVDSGAREGAGRNDDQGRTAGEAGGLAEADAPAREENLCLVVQGFGSKTDPQSGRTLDLDASWTIIRAAVERTGLTCVRADEEMASGGELYHLLLAARLVIADLSAGVPEVLLQLGLRCGLRPGQTVVVADAQLPLPVDLARLRILRYFLPGNHYVLHGNQIDTRKAEGFPAELNSAIHAALASATVDSPVYLALPGLRPPRLAPNGVDAEDSGATSEAAPAEVVEEAENAPAATGETIAVRLLIIRLHGESGLRFIPESPPAPARSEWTRAYPRAIMDTLLARLRQASPRLDRKLATALADLLLPRELAALAPALAYRLIVAGEAAALPWELILAYRPRGWQPVSVLRRLDGLHTPAQATTTGRSMLLVGNPLSRGSFTDEDARRPPPANVIEDLERLSRLLEARGCEVALVNAGDAEAVLARLYARDYRLVLISATAVRQHRQPDGSTITGFVLSDGLFLTAREIEQMRSVPEVMVLNDYQAGQGGLSEEMVPALLRAGVRCVVAPAWTLDQRLPTLFCQHLLLALADGQRFEAACFAAREVVFKAGPELATWAAYQAWGDPDFILSPTTAAA
ncbi:MAG: CHAT domain-containing protein [Candidatus Accumulibacter sp. UW27]|jgi:hypothetical protein